MLCPQSFRLAISAPPSWVANIGIVAPQGVLLASCSRYMQGWLRSIRMMTRPATCCRVDPRRSSQRLDRRSARGATSGSIPAVIFVDGVDLLFELGDHFLDAREDPARCFD